MKSLLIEVLAFSSVTYAAEDVKIVAAKADSTKCEALYTNGDPARNITACISCHGAAGSSTITSHISTSN